MKLGFEQEFFVQNTGCNMDPEDLEETERASLPQEDGD